MCALRVLLSKRSKNLNLNLQNGKLKDSQEYKNKL